ncbi:hypothetical protein GNI_036200 [Gregarina niphandrodes]|uniref:EF-hand domain-containing protein n=1 Tax=Gregarina niphandrodes TaxID=110365 RepID=A0A023BAX9_GRENI|nr:hypothetical protein GNI_036200 [Gregarina niphandrodes]EZG78454.1 hypothetical protein GNI_036200 [Gregarina niphandrodes]|eukprot:XP_011129302.1 hypothetical protein GNI_036200 [Gregarina niphandrodes]
MCSRQFKILADPKSALLDKYNTKFLFRSMGQVPSEKDLNSWVDEFFMAVTGKAIEGLTFDQFIDFYCRYCQGLPSLGSVITLFGSFDPKRTGFLSKVVLKRVLQMGETPLSDDELAQFFKICDIAIPSNNDEHPDAVDYVLLAKSILDPQTFFENPAK